VHVDPPAALVSMPEECQRPSGDIWVVREGQLVVLRPRPLQVSGGRVVFDAAASGLVAGDRVVVSQLSNPRPGMAVVEAGVAAAPARTADTTGETEAL